MAGVLASDDQMAVEVHAYADPATGTGDAVLGYLPNPPTRDGPYVDSRWSEPVPLDQAGRWPRWSAYALAREFDGVHKWRGKRARRWAIAVPGAE